MLRKFSTGSLMPEKTNMSYACEAPIFIEDIQDNNLCYLICFDFKCYAMYSSACLYVYFALKCYTNHTFLLGNSYKRFSSEVKQR